MIWLIISIIFYLLGATMMYMVSSGDDWVIIDNEDWIAILLWPILIISFLLDIAFKK